MAYFLEQVTICTNNTDECTRQIDELWQDIFSGKLPLLFDTEHKQRENIIPLVEYCNYENGAEADYDMSILAVTAKFFDQLELQTARGFMKKYEASDPKGNLKKCLQKAWEAVWADQRTEKIRRAFTYDYESSLPAAQAPDGQAHCSLYISVKK